MAAEKLGEWTDLDELLFQMGKGVHRTTPLDSKVSQVSLKPVSQGESPTDSGLDLETSIEMGDIHGEVPRPVSASTKSH